jgi:hypothetical protein
MKVTIERQIKKGDQYTILNVPYIGLEDKLNEYLNSNNNYVCRTSIHKKSPNNITISNEDIIGKITKINNDNIELELNKKGIRYYKSISSPIIVVINSGRPELDGYYIDNIIKLIIKNKS